jgi:hypothetical protein
MVFYFDMIVRGEIMDVVGLGRKFKALLTN